MTTVGNDEFAITYQINNNKRTAEENRRIVDVQASRAEIDSLVENGYLVKQGWFTEEALERMRAALDRLEEAERDLPGAEYREGNGFFVRSLQAKDEVFGDLAEFYPPLSVARAVLGPQVTFEVDARIAYEQQADKYVPWHIHRRVVPQPLPPFFTYPHGVHCLLYLNDVGPDEGPLVVLPGSHRDGSIELPYHGSPHVPGEVMISPHAGDAVLIHSNLWHRTVPTSDTCGRRRLVIIGYDPAWLNTNPPGLDESKPLADWFGPSPDPSVRELLGGFQW